MKKKIDEDFPVGKVTIIPNFLPTPEELVFPKDKTVKVTLILTKASVDFFKNQAKKRGTKYQAMIRILVDKYRQNFKG